MKVMLVLVNKGKLKCSYKIYIELNIPTSLSQTKDFTNYYNKFYFVKFEVFEAMTKMTMLRVLEPYTHVSRYQSLEETCCVQLHNTELHHEFTCMQITL
jgi:hypothetical protein